MLLHSGKKQILTIILACSEGTFGADCKQTCHCADGASCETDTGRCSGNLCADGWKGINCQGKGCSIVEILNAFHCS